jgi:hypothetical protein
MRGVVNQEIPNLTTESPTGPTKHAVLDPSAPANPVTLFSGGNQPPQRLHYDAMVPANIKAVFHDTWNTELLGSGVHIHSKVIVLDPFGENPVVMTGSHNLGFKASSENDDNLMVVEENAPLAAAYAANIIAIYQSYRWNAYVEAHRQDPQVWHGLVDNDAWQGSHLQGDDLAEIQFWIGSPTAAGSVPAAAPASGRMPARTASATGPAPTQPGKVRSIRGSARQKKAAAKRKAPVKKQARVKKKAPARQRAPAEKKTSAKKKGR